MPLPTDAFWSAAEKELLDILVSHLMASAKVGGQQALAGLGEGVSVDFALVNRAVEKWAREMGLELVKGINDTSRKAATQAIADWIDSGAAIDDLMALLEPWFGATRAEMIAVTEVTRAFAEGNVAAWRESGVVDRVKWQTAVDELVCPICGPLAGTTDTLDGDFGGVGHPPAHVRCRCWLLPVVTE